MTLLGKAMVSFFEASNTVRGLLICYNLLLILIYLSSLNSLLIASHSSRLSSPVIHPLLPISPLCILSSPLLASVHVTTPRSSLSSLNPFSKLIYHSRTYITMITWSTIMRKGSRRWGCDALKMRRSASRLLWLLQRKHLLQSSWKH